MRYEVQVTMTSVYSFALEAEAASVAQMAALTSLANKEPEHVTFEIQLDQGVR